MPHILQLPGNTQGADFIITDPHGCRDLVAMVIDRLASGDRLLIAGDVCDRGPASWPLFQLIQAEMSKMPQQVFMIRGNHEDMLLNRLTGSREKGDTQYNEWVAAQTDEERRALREFLSSLPYIITVQATENVSAFHMVHADMPCDDTELLRKLQQKHPRLTSKEVAYATWARPHRLGDSELQPTSYRTKNSTRVYCGHSSFGGPRVETNCINLDMGTPRSGCLPVLNHTKNELQVVESPVVPIEYKPQLVRTTALIKVSLLADVIVQSNVEAVLQIEQLIQDIVKECYNGSMKNPYGEKQYYLYLLTHACQCLDQPCKEAWGLYLLQNARTHVLAKERGWLRSITLFARSGEAHSVETASMHTALGLLFSGSNRISMQSTTGHIKIQCDDQSSVMLTRHISHFKNTFQPVSELETTQVMGQGH